MDYRIEGMTIHFDEDETDTYLLITDDMGLAVTLEGDLGVVTPTNLEQSMVAYTQDELIGTTLYYLADDSTSYNPYPMLATLSFSEYDVEISEPMVRDGDSMSVPWTIENGKLLIQLSDDNPSDNDIVRTRKSKGQNVSIVEDSGPHREYFAATFVEATLAISVYLDWKYAIER
jgi:hypothetical protein